jgi:hypothetical protein
MMMMMTFSLHHHSPPSSAEVKEWVELYLHSPNTPSWRGAQGDHRDNFTFAFIFYLYRVQNYSGAHSASYPMGTGVSFPGGKAAGA